MTYRILPAIDPQEVPLVAPVTGYGFSWFYLEPEERASARRNFPAVPEAILAHQQWRRLTPLQVRDGALALANTVTVRA